MRYIVAFSLIFLVGNPLLARNDFVCFDNESGNQVLEATLIKSEDNKETTIDNVLILDTDDSKEFSKFSRFETSAEDFTKYRFKSYFNQIFYVDPNDCTDFFCQIWKAVTYQPFGINFWIGEGRPYLQVRNPNEFPFGYKVRFDFDVYNALNAKDFRATINFENDDYYYVYVDRNLNCKMI